MYEDFYDDYLFESAMDDLTFWDDDEPFVDDDEDEFGEMPIDIWR